MFINFSNYPTKLYLHRNKQFLDISGRMGYFVHLNETTQHQAFTIFLLKIIPTTVRNLSTFILLDKARGLQATCSSHWWRCQLQRNRLWSLHVQGIVDIYDLLQRIVLMSNILLLGPRKPHDEIIWLCCTLDHKQPNNMHWQR